ncbi:serine hydrolase domain-containing protein [Flagellimonas meishanensis]|uniref:serine hydrolase domain-containing protein n=1 Tax=Flagellimonas meishanensis TaxID=2873264 RepID=UPI001CA70964|nr:serine hydrolase domain-containing protein [[Muricauda] meishanensis]
MRDYGMRISFILFLFLIFSCSTDSQDSTLEEVPMEEINPLDVQVQQARNIILEDIANKGNASDLRVSFERAPNEENIKEYRVIIAKTSTTLTLELGESLSRDRFLTVNPNGSNVSLSLPETLLDSSGNVISEGNSYTAYVLSIADGIAAGISSLSTSSNALNFLNELTKLENLILEEMGVWNINALAVATVENGTITYAKGFGIHNQQDGISTSDNTLFVTMSLAKLVVAVAVMQQVDLGNIDLDSDVSSYIGFDLRHPNFPEVTITPRMLMSHQAGLANPDASEIPELNLSYQAGTAPALSEWIPDYLVPSGPNYNPLIWKEFAPGTGNHISSNVGMSILAYAVEMVSGQDYRNYTENNIFIPLGMINTKHRMGQPGSYEDALLSDNFSASGNLLLEYLGSPVYPSVFLRTSVMEWSNFLIMVLNKGLYENSRILNEASIDEMLQIAYPNANLAFGSGVGLVWRNNFNNWIGHTGGGFITSSTDVNLGLGKGVIILCNQRQAFTVSPDITNGKIYWAIHKYLETTNIE